MTEPRNDIKGVSSFAIEDPVQSSNNAELRLPLSLRQSFESATPSPSHTEGNCVTRLFGNIYAIAKNGMWDDPVEAVQGWIFKTLDAHPETNADTAPYLAWRFSYILCGIVFTAVDIVLTAYAFRLQIVSSRLQIQPGDDIRPINAFTSSSSGALPISANGADVGDVKTAFKSLLPPGVGFSQIRALFIALTMQTMLLLLCKVVTCVLAVVALWFAQPSKAVSKIRLSIVLIRWAWGISFFVTFWVWIFYPYRSAIDWNGIEACACNATITSMLNNKFLQLSEGIASLKSLDILGSDLQDLDMQNVHPWCTQSGRQWHSKFFGSAIQCVWEGQDRCSTEICIPLYKVDPIGGQDCTLDCLSYVSNLPRKKQPLAVKEFMTWLTGCTDRHNGTFMVPPAPRPSSPTLIANVSSASFREVLAFASYTVRSLAVSSSLAVGSASRTAELAVGGFAGAAAFYNLLGASLSIVTGLTEGLINTKAVFPSCQMPAWMLILTTMLPLPVRAAEVALAVQLLGDVPLIAGTQIFLLYGATSALTGQLVLRLKTGEQERWKLYKTVWIQYGIALGCFIAMGVCFYFWAMDHAYLSQKILGVFWTEYCTARSVTSFLVSYFAGKIFTAVGATDGWMQAMISTELWSITLPREDRHRLHATVLNLHLLGHPEERQAVADKLVAAGWEDVEECVSPYRLYADRAESRKAL